MDCSTPGFLVLHCLPEFAQTHVRWVSDAIQESHLLPLLSPLGPQSFQASGSFPVRQLFASGGQGIEASASVLPVNIQGWFPLGWTVLISLLSRGLWRVFSSTTIQKRQFFGTQPSFLVWLSHPYMTTGKIIGLTPRTSVSKVMALLLNTLFRFIIAFLPRSKCLLTSWLQSTPSTVILELKNIKPVTISIVSPSIYHEVMGPDAMILVFWMLSFYSAFSLFLFHLHQEAL